MLLDGDGVRANIREGLRWLRRAAERGDPIAQYNLGKAYAEGECVRQSTTYAKKWLARANERGHAKARRLLQKLELE
jgi:TPR repeat protein